MESFLQLVAQDLYNKLGNDLSKVALIFPNKRASLFFNEYLADQSNKPIWSPAYISISELFQQLSDLKLGDPIRLICELYKIFKEETRSEETLDDFYFWGELLIADFDDIDKNQVIAEKLFSNLQELKNIMDDLDFLDEEQEAAIQQFFHNFSIEKRTVLKERFISLWDCLGSIYSRYKERLTELGIAYEGMLYREVMETLDTDTLGYDKFVFVGFNVLNKVEHNFFKKLHDKGKALFYWDYDIFYSFPSKNQDDKEGIRKSYHEAGEFILRNLRDFGNELPSSYFDVLRQPKNVTYLASATESAQARYIPQWLDTLPAGGEEKENAVVLCNETLLLTTLHSIPDTVQNVNITMGFPLAQTPIFSFVNAYIELQTSGYRPDSGRYIYDIVKSVLNHPYTRLSSENAEQLEKDLTKKNRFYPLPSELQQDAFLKLVFTPINSILSLCKGIGELLKEIASFYKKEKDADDIFNQLYRESLFKCYTVVSRLTTLIETGELQVRIDTLKRLLNRILTSANIPFHGEPAIGMQVMGVLETRNLDFKNLLILSLNEGQLPKSGGTSSFIPYNLRKAFGMTTIEHKISVYAYYFYRLIQRAENITLSYNTSSDGLNRGEMSRFMLQFLIEWAHPIHQEYLEAGQEPQARRDISIAKTPEIQAQLCRRFDMNTNPQAGILSPSALNTYLDCPLKFYYRYIAAIQMPNEISAEIDSALFGTIFHRAAEIVYETLCANTKMINKDDLEKLLKDNALLERYVEKAFKEDFFHISDSERPEYNGLQLINSKVIVSYLKQLLRNDLLYAPFEMVGMEKKIKEEVTLSNNIRLTMGGIIDRIDLKEGTIRIVDYKTGGQPKNLKNMEELFTPSDKRPNYIFQTFLYASIGCKQDQYKVAPALLYIHRAASESYSPVIEIGERKEKRAIEDFNDYNAEFRTLLLNLLEEIFGENTLFCQTGELKKCTYCDFKSLCKR